MQISGKKVRGCFACGKCYKIHDRRCVIDNDVVNGCIEKMVESDGIILASPTHFTDVSTEMKALIDRAGYVARVNNHLFRWKVGAAVVAARRAGAIHTFDTLNYFFLISQMIVPGSSYWSIGMGIAPDEVKFDKEGLETMKTLGTVMAWLIEKVQG